MKGILFQISVTIKLEKWLPILKNNFILDIKKNTISCNGNAKIIDIHNFFNK